MTQLIPIQSLYSSDHMNHLICDFKRRTMQKETSPVIHSMSRMCLVNEGKATISINNKEYFIMKGSIISILPWQITDIIDIQEPLEYEMLTYHFDTIHEIIKTFYNPENIHMSVVKIMKSFPVLTMTEEKYYEMKRIFSVLEEETKQKNKGYDDSKDQLSNFCIINKLIDIFLYFLRSNQDQETNMQEGSSDILEYMYLHLNGKLTIGKLAQRFYMSESSIRSYVKKTTGYTVSDLLNEMRIGKMVNYLLYTDLTIEELAKILGFADDSHICKVFKSKMGMTVNDFRNMYQIIGEKCHIQDRKIFYEIVEYIYHNYAEDLQIKEVSEKFHISTKELNEILLYQLEQNFNEFLNHVRIIHASDLLIKTNKSILEIALEVGFKSEKTFSRNFVQNYGVTASKFRKNIISEQ